MNTSLELAAPAIEENQEMAQGRRLRKNNVGKYFAIQI